MPQKYTTFFFVDVFTPNEGEEGLCLEYGILRWSEGKAESRPEVYVHSYLRPISNNSRIRWANAAQMHITRDFLEEKGNLPSIEDMIEADYLKKRVVVCFDPSGETYSKLLRHADTVISIKDLWQRVYKNEERALACETLDRMCDYIGLIGDNNENTNYTPLLKRLHRITALWSLLNEIEKSPRLKHKIGFGGMQTTFSWPLPATESEWFKNDPSSLDDLSEDEIKEFFSSNLADRLNWFDMNMYACDWVYNRKPLKIARELSGKGELASYIFSHVLSFKMQIWVLIFYSHFLHKKEDALQIALNRGGVSSLRPAAKESFINFMIENLESFLTHEQKSHLITSLIRQSLSENDKIPFTPYDYEKLEKLSREHHDGPRMYFTGGTSMSGEPTDCFREIRDHTGRTVYRRFIIKGRDKERTLCVETVQYHINGFYKEATNPLADIWLRPTLKLWIQYVTGVSFSEITRSQKMNDGPQLNGVRMALKETMIKEATPYLRKLYENLENYMLNTTKRVTEEERFRFTFQGISVEMIIQPPTKLGIFRHLFTFK